MSTLLPSLTMIVVLAGTALTACELPTLETTEEQEIEEPAVFDVAAAEAVLRELPDFVDGIAYCRIDMRSRKIGVDEFYVYDQWSTTEGAETRGCFGTLVNEGHASYGSCIESRRSGCWRREFVVHDLRVEPGRPYLLVKCGTSTAPTVEHLFVEENNAKAKATFSYTNKLDKKWREAFSNCGALLAADGEVSREAEFESDSEGTWVVRNQIFP